MGEPGGIVVAVIAVLLPKVLVKKCPEEVTPEPGRYPLLFAVYITIACPMERRLARHLTVWADARALFRAGRRIEISNAMIPMTTSSSTRVKPRGRRRLKLIDSISSCG